jgi:formylglycine-generating enzyme required for sulfatase activity
MNAGKSASAADDPELAQLLKTFVDELVPITPGIEKFPATLVVPFSGDVVDGQPKTFKLDEPFAIAKYEVPQNLYAAVMGSNPSKWTGPRNSVEMMTWNEANQFCEKLTELLRKSKLIEETEEIRLPTEIEWEYCCRAGTDTAYSFGDRAQADGDADKIATILNQYGWHTGNAAGNDPPVGALKPNPWGLYDLHGYLWEFCSDPWSAEVVDNATDPQLFSDRIVIRGGSWKDRFEKLTSASRREFAIDARDDAVGIRCVRAKVQ